MEENLTNFEFGSVLLYRKSYFCFINQDGELQSPLQTLSMVLCLLYIKNSFCALPWLHCFLFFIFTSDVKYQAVSCVGLWFPLILLINNLNQHWNDCHLRDGWLIPGEVMWGSCIFQLNSVNLTWFQNKDQTYQLHVFTK